MMDAAGQRGGFRKKRPCQRHDLFGGSGWIRTTEVVDNRFTVCPLWPLGNAPIYTCQAVNSEGKVELVDGLEPPTC